MLDDRTFYRMVAYLRKNFAWSSQFRAESNDCKVGDGIKQCKGCDSLIDPYQGGDYADMYENILVGTEEVPVYFERFHIDHIDPVGSFKDNKSLDYAAKRIFCARENLMGLCHSCHLIKTNVDMQEMREEKKNAGKD